MSITETHLKTYEDQKEAYNKGNGSIFFNSLFGARKAQKGTALFHILNNKRKRFISNENLIQGKLQWTRFFSRNKPINIITVYASSDGEDDDEIINIIIHLLLKCENEFNIVLGDFNINTRKPQNSREKEWKELIECFQLKELIIPENYTYVRKVINSVQKSRPDHIFVSNNIRIIREVILPPISKNDHLPFYIDIELETDYCWRNFISRKDMNQISTTLNESHYDSFDALQKDISEMVNKFSFKDDKTNLKYINTINKKEIKTKEIELLHLVTQGKGQNIEEIEKLRNNIKVLYKETGADIKAKLSENFNKHDSSMIYQFDKHLKEKSIDWKNIQFSEEEIVHHFETKFTSVSKSSDFENPPSTVKKGPKIPQISLKTIKEAISRMKSNTPGLDSISFQIIRNLKDEHLQLIADQFENCIQQGNIPEEWKSGWVKLLPKRDIQKLNDIRPITILPIYYRILFNIIAYELRQWASKHINLRQQAFISHRNTMNHGLLLSSLAKKNKSSFLLVNLDIEGAYDSVEDHIIEKALTH